MNLTTATPAEIDAEWAPLASETFQTRSALWSIQRAVSAVESGYGVDYQQRALARQADRIPSLNEKLAKAIEAEEPYLAEWNRRSGWTRAYLVITNGQGHVHRSTHCSTCYVTTSFAWLTEQSGATEQEIVDLAGERACTVCYASAPVELRLDRPTQLFSEDEKRKQIERTEREAARAAKKAAEIEVPEYTESYRSQAGKTFKSVRAVTNAIAQELGYLVWLGPNATHEANIAACRAALAAKGVEYDYDKALAAARKKANRDFTSGSKY